jgi:biotin carboxylase
VTVLLIATTTGYQIRSFSDAAGELGIRLVIASDRCDHLEDPWRDGAIPVRFHEPGASALHLKAAFGDHPPDGIIAVGDRPTLLAAHAAAVFGLRGNSATAAVRSRNKLEAREAFRSVGLLAPSYLHVGIDADARTIAGTLAYPVVVKPLGLSGSRGVMRADTPQEFVAAFARLRQLLQSADIRLERDPIHESALIESFIPGHEYAIEGVLTDGVFIPLAIFDKPDPLDGPFFEETIYVTPSRAPASTQNAVVDAVASAARALGLVHGPIHAECRVNAEGVYVLEIAARPIGGLCSRALRFTHAGKTVSLETVLLLHAVGEPLDAVAREACASAVMMIPIPHRGVFKGVDGVESAQRIPLIDDIQITAKRDALLTPLPEGRSYLGFIFARGDSAGEVEAAVRQAHRDLAFAIEREFPVVAGA